MRAFIFAFVTLIAVFTLQPHARAQDCTDPDGDLGVLLYNTDYGVFQGCADGGWIAFHDPCTGDPTPGRICADGSIYAGTTVGGAKMYVTRCDAGMSWDEGLGACTGTQALMNWDNNPGCVLCGDGPATTGIDSDDDGMANVAAMRAWVEGNTANGDLNGFDAARYCDGLSGAGGHGRDDWYLPAENELVTIWNKLADGAPDVDADKITDDFQFYIGGEGYWSSSESDDGNSRIVCFSSCTYTRLHPSAGEVMISGIAGKVGSAIKSGNHLVRCARRD